MMGLATVSACCLMVLIASDKRVELVEEADGLELNAFLSSTQAADFKNLRNEQASLEAEVDSLEKRERQMQPEDTKVSPRPILTPSPCLSHSPEQFDRLLSHTSHPSSVDRRREGSGEQGARHFGGADARREAPSASLGQQTSC